MRVLRGGACAVPPVGARAARGRSGPSAPCPGSRPARRGSAMPGGRGAPGGGGAGAPREGQTR